MSNLKFSGVSKSLKNTSFPFMYNDLEGLKKIINSKNIGIIIMEVLRNKQPKDNFLQQVRKICNKKKLF